jgi:hypothetical protein
MHFPAEIDRCIKINNIRAVYFLFHSKNHVNEAWIYQSIMNLAIPEDVLVLSFIPEAGIAMHPWIQLVFADHMMEFGHVDRRRLYFLRESTDASKIHALSHLHKECRSQVHFIVIPSADAQITAAMQHALSNITSSGRLLQPILPSFQPYVDLYQHWMLHVQLSPDLQQLFEKTVIQVLKVFSTIPDRTVFCAGTFIKELTLHYLPFNAILLFDHFVRHHALVRAEPDFVKQHRRGDRHILHCLNRAAVDAWLGVLQSHPTPLVQEAVKEVETAVASITILQPSTVNANTLPKMQATTSFEAKKKVSLKEYTATKRSATRDPSPSRKKTKADDKIAELTFKHDNYVEQLRRFLEIAENSVQSRSKKLIHALDQTKFPADERIRRVVKRAFHQWGDPSFDAVPARASLPFDSNATETTPMFRGQVKLHHTLIESTQVWPSAQEALADVNAVVINYLKVYLESLPLRGEKDIEHDQDDSGEEEGEVFEEESECQLQNAIQALNEFTQKARLAVPEFRLETKPQEQLYRASVVIDKIEATTPSWHRSASIAKHEAALVLLRRLGQRINMYLKAQLEDGHSITQLRYALKFDLSDLQP